MTRHSKVFVPVSVDEKLPQEGDHFFINEKGYKISSAWDGRDADIAWAKRCYPHWLEEKENVYVLTEDELAALITEYEIALHKNDLISAFTFLQSKTNPQTENK